MRAPKIHAGLAFDFDGVIWDSVGECWHVALAAWKQMGGSVSSDPSMETAFRAARPLVRTGQDFYVVMRFLQEGRGRDLGAVDLAELDRLRAGWREPSIEFDGKFYAERERMREEDFATWSAWQGPYPGIPEAVRELVAAVDVIAITTTKDEASVHRLLATVGLEMTVLGKGLTRDKTRQIQHLAEGSGLEPSRILLIDDLLENLEMARRAGARGAMAAWGYNTAAGRDEAHSAGFPLLEPEGLARQVLGIMKG